MQREANDPVVEEDFCDRSTQKDVELDAGSPLAVAHRVHTGEHRDISQLTKWAADLGSVELTLPKAYLPPVCTASLGFTLPFESSTDSSVAP